MISRDSTGPVRTCVSEPKWFAVVGDQPCPMPREQITREVLLQQSGLPDNHVLVRDRSAEHDEVIVPGSAVNLADGNVFRLLPPCSAISSNCDAKPKLAFSVDDHVEVTLNPNQTKDSLLGLFGLDADCVIARDLESATDQPIDNDDHIQFADGPVFTKASRNTASIIVNGRRKVIATTTLTFTEIVALAYDTPPSGPNVCFTVTYRGGCDNAAGTLVEGESIDTQNGMVINVTATDKS